MAYGSGKRLGETIDPRLMMADFSGFERAGQIMGQGFANTGKQIGDTIKQRNENEKEIASKIKMAEAIKKAVPPLEGMADQVIRDLTNPDLSTSDKLRASAGINEAMQISLLGNQEQRAQEEFNMRKAAAGAAASARRSADADKIIEAQNLMKAFPSQIAILEASGFGPQAQAYKDQYDKAMAAGDINTAMTLAGTVSGFTGAMKPSTLQPVQPTASPQELASSVKDALEIGVTNAVDVQPNLVQLFNDSLKSGDSKRAAKIATDITNTVNTQVETQQKESKDIVKLQDGSEVLLGKTTGTRFTPDGKAIPRTSPIYTQPIAERETTIEEKITKLREAKELYEKGDKQGALNIMNAIGTGGLFGKTITMEELDSQMQGQTNQESNSKTREEIKQKLFPE